MRIWHIVVFFIAFCSSLFLGEIGSTLNLRVMESNGGTMPVFAWFGDERAHTEELIAAKHARGDFTHSIMKSDSHWKAAADWIPWGGDVFSSPRFIKSPGDVLISDPIRNGAPYIIGILTTLYFLMGFLMRLKEEPIISLGLAPHQPIRIRTG